MAVYEVYPTRWDDPHVVEERIPATGLRFTMPLCEHGEAAFTATVEPGRSFWRSGVALPFSGALITRDGVPVWDGWITAERQTSARTFEFTAKEWGSFFETTPARVATYRGWNDHAIFRDLIASAQSVPGQNVQVLLRDSEGATTSDLTINAWDGLDTETVIRRLGSSEGGPEWYFGVTGTLEEPQRVLQLADRHGQVSAVDTLMFVEDTETWKPYPAPPTIGLLSDLLPAGTQVPALGRRGGNVVACLRGKDTARSATAIVAIGDGFDEAQLRTYATADRLIAQGWPRMTRWTSYSSVILSPTLQRHANADLAATAGITTGYNLITIDGDPDWTQVPRGSSMKVVLDTDVYAGPRPYAFTTRLLATTVNVPDDGSEAQITWDLAEVLEAA